MSDPVGVVRIHAALRCGIALAIASIAAAVRMLLRVHVILGG